PWVREVFPAQELGARVIPYDSGGEHRGPRGRLRIARALRAERFDAAILFQNAFDAALLTWLAGIPLRTGYSRQGRRPLLTHPIRPPRKQDALGHESHYYLELLRRLGLIQQYSVVERIALPASEASRWSARAQLCKRIEQEIPASGVRRSDPELLVGISPGATFGTAKRWPAPRFAELAARLHQESGATNVFFGSPQEKDLAEEVMALAGVPSLSLAGRTSLAEFMQLIHGCDLFVTNDTGTMHVAAALGVPTLAIFGPTNENETRPLGDRVKLVTGEAFCRPCKLRHCPIDHRCMTSVSVERVLQAALHMVCKENVSPQAPRSSARSPVVFEQGQPR
ncbi:MAG: lipopolysaccharide heptosyltransferase II, partial [Acidobacteria bacterium]|nr:lipopolysaccharide heptosyltransferase II [Acidobacteriota bacterium]